MYFSSPEELEKIIPICDGVWNKEYLYEYLVMSCNVDFEEYISHFFSDYLSDENLADMLFSFLLDDYYDGSDSQTGAAWLISKLDRQLLQAKKELLLKVQSNEVFWKRPFPHEESLDFLFVEQEKFSDFRGDCHMKIVIVHGQSHEGTTCHIARMLAEKLHGDTLEFFLPRDFHQFCTGCTACFMQSETKCPHYEKLKPINEAFDEADVIILASPVYVYHATGAMKAFLDHYGYRWMVHRPEAKMFAKQAVCISTAAGAGMKSTNKDMADSTFFWGCARTYKIGVSVRATSWDHVSPKIKAKVEHKTTMLANKIRKKCGKVKPLIKTKLFFMIMRMMQKSGWNKTDQIYWQDKGWLGRKRPWK